VPCLWAARHYDAGLRLVADGELRATWLHSATGRRRNVTDCATNVVCAHLENDAYNATTHARPRADAFVCGPWRSTRCPDGKVWHSGPKARSCATFAACRRAWRGAGRALGGATPSCPDRNVSCPPRSRFLRSTFL
jgi:hypothetical protein